MSANRTDVVIGTRGSALALAQASLVAAMLEQAGAAAELLVIRTSGDAGAEPLSESPTGIFVKEIEHALLDGRADLAVHSMKDLPTGDRPGLVVAAVPERADPHDALVSRTGVGLAGLPPGSTIGTSSPRRTAQLRAARADLSFVSVRGNVDTRLRKLANGEFDALIVAYAGLLRLGLADRASEIIPFELCLPAPGQGALALQVRERDSRLREIVAQLDHEPSRLAAVAERAVLSRLGAGCTLPVGALGTVDGQRLILRATMASEQNGSVARREITGPAQEAEALGRRLAEQLLTAESETTAMEG